MFFALLIIFVLLSVSVFKETRRNTAIGHEVKKAQSELDRINQNNKDLGDMVSFFQSEQYVEKQARTKLGYKKAGESVLVLSTDGVTGDFSSSTSESSVQSSSNKESNPLRWLKFFFGGI